MVLPPVHRILGALTKRWQILHRQKGDYYKFDITSELNYIYTIHSYIIY